MEFRNNHRALTIGLLFLLTLMAATSCKQEISPRLKEIDRSINKDYKIGEQALDSMERLGLLEAKPNYMYSKLLRLKIADKGYHPIKNRKKEIDSLVNYFQDQKDGDALAQAYYLAGRVNSDLGDSPKALISIKKQKKLSIRTTMPYKETSIVKWDTYIKNAIFFMTPLPLSKKHILWTL